MRPYEFPTFAMACEQLSHRLRFKSKLVHSARWQGADIANRPEMATHELTHTAFCVNLPHEDRDMYAADIRPNMPWAEDHFRERVCGAPINPGLEWERWPYNKSAATFLDHRGMFNHNYMERYWPKQAGKFDIPTQTASSMGNRAQTCGEEKQEDYQVGSSWYHV
jgi:hypothetical protein